MALFNFNSPIECLYQIQHSKYATEDIAIGPDDRTLITYDSQKLLKYGGWISILCGTIEKLSGHS